MTALARIPPIQRFPGRDVRGPAAPATSAFTPRSGREGAAPAIVEQVLRAPGQPLDAATRAFAESRFGCDFSQVRVHAGAAAGAAASAIAARAFTAGHHVVFAPGEFVPESATGRRLLAHELAHVVQQRSGAGLPGGVLPADHSSEREAESAADATRRPAPGESLPRPFLPGVPRPERVGALPTIQRAPNFQQMEADRVAQELKTLIAGATWKEIRKRVYPKESAAGIQRARERHAGNRPDLTGLGSAATLDHFAKAVRGVQRNWHAATPDKRTQALGDAANVELAGAGVPKFLAVDKEAMEGRAFFSQTEWKLVISETTVGLADLNDTDAGELAGTTLHESRHAEQAFLAARFAAGINNADAAAIANDVHIPRSIANAAVAKKFDAHTDLGTTGLGRRMFQAEVTDAAANQAKEDIGLDELNKKRVAAQTALRDLTASADAGAIATAKTKRDELKAEIGTIEQNYTQYRNIPFEADAHEVGDSEELAFHGWPKGP